MKQLKGCSVTKHVILKAQEKANITPSVTQHTSVTITSKLREAHKHLHELQRKHVELRENHLESLAEARVLKNKPDLKLQHNKFRVATDKEIRRILRNERCSRSHRSIRRYLRPDDTHRGLSKVDVPAGPAAEPSTWEGPWETVTKPADIATSICEANAKQYHQAHNTPFASEPLLSYFGLNAEKAGSSDLLRGIMPPQNILEKMLPETRAIIQTIADLPAGPSIDTEITTEKFQQLYKIIPEKTASSPSGRHVGHYKAIAQSEDLSELWTIMMKVPHISGFSPRRWQQVVDVMLEKTPGNSKIHRLRIIALQESDFNQGNRLAIGRPLMHHLEDTQGIPAMQHGSRAAKLCISAVLNKQLQMEIQRYKKQPLAYIENDATGCYDRIVNPLVLLFLRKIGIPTNTVRSLAQTWAHTSHKIKTLYGISDQEYKNAVDFFLYGPGQGSTIGPILWLICFLLIVQSLSRQAPSMSMRSVDGTVVTNARGDAFVDDAGLGCTAHIPKSADIYLVQRTAATLPTQLEILAQQWERLLFSTGGALNLNKCFWFLLSWTWKGGRPILQTTSSLPAIVRLTAGQDIGDPKVIKRIEPTASYRTLGVHISPSGNNKGAIAVLQDITLTYAQAITGSHLDRTAVLMSYVQHLLPRLRFQLPALSLTDAECHAILSPALQATLPKLHVNRNTARSIIHGPVTIGGMALPNLSTVQGIDKLHLLLGHVRLQDETGRLIKIDLSYVQLLSGSATFVLNRPYNEYTWLEWGWVTSLWKFISQTQLTFIFPAHWLPKPSRQGDLLLMDYFIALRLQPAVLGTLNRCRVYLQVLTLSDITSADGSYILPEANLGQHAPTRHGNYSIIQIQPNYIYRGKEGPLA